ncbi:MAG TPA: bacillithiol biosynthesis deacetylase BshB1, partial [Candidatus Eisenbacteria bacterium]|nr:bacillithiol biosynthesis deacetylase BshB1 [Candidatus Eisenbacteria bacterium]
SVGGTLALAASQGFAAGILDLTAGELGTNGTPEVRAREAVDAAAVLGLAGRWCAKLPDGGLSALDVSQERVLVGWLRRLRPTILLSHFPKDRHPDHIQASQLVERAWYHAGLARYGAHSDADLEAVAAKPLEPFRPKARYWFASRIGFHPSMVVDVTTTWETKRRAILAHKSQVIRDGVHSKATALNDPEFLTRIEARMRHYGGMIGVKYGEPFTSDMPLGVVDLSAVLGSPKPVPGAFTG